MCDAVTLTVVGIGAAVASTALGVASNVQQGRAAAEAAEFNAATAARNAVLAERFARDARERGEFEVARHRLEVAQVEGAQRAAIGARNIDLGSGLALAILGDTARFGELDALSIRNAYEREAIGFETQRQDFLAESALGRMTARNARVAGALGAVASGIGGFNTALTQYGSYRGWL